MRRLPTPRTSYSADKRDRPGASGYDALVPLRTALLMLWAGAATILAQTPLETGSTIRALDQWSSICKSDGLLLWGKSLCGPMVLANPSTRSAIGNRPDPEGTFLAGR